MFSTRTVVRTALLALSFFTFLQITSQTTYALELPFFGKIPFGNTASDKNLLSLDVLFGYRSSPQYYTTNQDTVEIRALVVNNENSTQTAKYETKIYRVASAWNSKDHSISYDMRFDYINAEPKDDALTLGEGMLRELFLDSQGCDVRTDEFCYQQTNLEDSDNPYGGITLDAKPVFATIGEEITLASGERTNISTQWKPEHCGYYRIVMKPFGYTEEFGEENKARDAYIRVKGCEDGEILDYGAVAIISQAPETAVGGVLGSISEIEHLPHTNIGILGYLTPIFGLMLGGTLMTRGINGMFGRKK